MKKTYERWYHGHGGWKYSEDCKCYYYTLKGTDPPNSYCLGNRYIYCQAGLDSYGIIWRGSISGGWGCCNFGYDLGKAIRWVRQANAKKLGCKLWGEKNFDPFSQDRRIQIVSEEDMEYLRGEPLPLKITIPVIIDKHCNDCGFYHPGGTCWDS